MAGTTINPLILTPLQEDLNRLSPECRNLIYELALTNVKVPIILPHPLTVALAEGTTGEIRVIDSSYFSYAQPNITVEYSSLLEQRAQELLMCDHIVANVVDLDFENLISCFLEGVSPPDTIWYLHVPIVVDLRFTAAFADLEDGEKEARVNRLFDWRREQEEADEGGKMVPLDMRVRDGTSSDGEEERLACPMDEVRKFVNGLTMQGYGKLDGTDGAYFHALRMAVAGYFGTLTYEEWEERERVAGMLAAPVLRETVKQMEARMRNDPEYGMGREALAAHNAARYTKEEPRRGGRERKGVVRM